jgi:hypothetical protein
MTLDPSPRLTVADLRRQGRTYGERFDEALEAARSLQRIVLDHEGALQAIAALPCPFGADIHETCDEIAQQYVVPDACPVCIARRALNEIASVAGDDRDHAAPASTGGGGVPFAHSAPAPDFASP